MATPIARDALALLRDHFRETDLSFELPESFQALATALEGNVYPWEGGPFDFDKLTGTEKEEGGEEKAEIEPVEGGD